MEKKCAIFPSAPISAAYKGNGSMYASTVSVHLASTLFQNMLKSFSLSNLSGSSLPF